MSRKTRPEGLYHVSRSLPHRQLRRPPPVARHRRLGRRRRLRSSCSTPRSAAAPTRASACPAPSRSARPTPSRTASRRRRSTPPTSSSTPRTASPAPTTKAAIEQAVEQLADGPHVIAVSSPYDPRGPTVSEDGQTAFATVGFDIEKVGTAEFDAAEKAVQDAPRRRHPGRVRRRPRLRQRAGRRQQRADRHPDGDRHPRHRLRLAGRDEPADRDGADRPSWSAAARSASCPASSPSRRSPASSRMMLGLGVGIDYALFILARHRQNLAAGQSVPVAIGRANATAGLSVLFAGVTVIVAILGLKVSGIPMMAMMGYGSAIMVAVIDAGLDHAAARDARRRQAPREQRPGPVRQAEAGLRPGRPPRHAGPPVSSPSRCATASSAAVILGVLAIPVFSMHLGLRRRGQRRADVDHPQGLRPDGRRLRPRHQRSAPGGARHRRRADRRGDHRRRSRTAWPTRPGVASVDQPVTNEAGDLAIIKVTPTTAPQDARTGELLEHLREDTIPAARRRHRRRGVGHRLDRPDRRRLVAAAAADAVVPRRRDRAVVPGADDRVPLGARAAEGRRPQRARRRSGVRRHRRGLPVGLGREPDRRPRDRADHAAGADADVRDPVRPLDGLRGVLDEPGPRAVPASTATRSVPWSRASARRLG